MKTLPAYASALLKLSLLFCLSTDSLLASNLHEHASQSHDVQNHGAHTHGTAQLNIAAEGSTLDIYFESPAANLVGFEYRAKTDEEKNAVSNLEHQLKAANALFDFHEADCTLADVKFDVSAIAALKENAPAEQKAHSHSHESDHEHRHEHHSSSPHEDISALYRFHCEAELTRIDVKLLQVFAAITRLNTAWINNNAQGAATLSPSVYRLSFK